MADILDFSDIFAETTESVRTRVEQDADADIDKRPGEIFYDLTTPIIFEMARMWDAINTMAATTFLPWSYGVYLDYKGLYEIGLPREEATQATGEVTFIGDKDVPIPAQTIVSTSARVITDSIYQYETLVDDQIGMNAATTAPTVTLSASSSSLDGLVSYKVSFVGRGGETEASPASTAVDADLKIVNLSNIPLGPSGTTARRIWRQMAGTGPFELIATLNNNTATTYSDSAASSPTTVRNLASVSQTQNIVTFTTSAAHGFSIDDPVEIAITTPSALGYDGDYIIVGVPSSTTFTIALLTNATLASTPITTGTATRTIEAPTANTTDRVTIPVRSITFGSSTNQGIGAIDTLIDAIAGVISVTNETQVTGGQSTESDDDYRDRLIASVSSISGQGNISDYENWAVGVEGVDAAKVIPIWNGANTVKVVLVGPDNNTVSAAVVAEVQDLIDPNSGDGSGLAPIGAVVTVQSVSGVNVTVNATIVHEDGYSLDGTNGTSPTRDAIETAIEDYLRALPAGGDVIWAEVLARIVTVLGVADVTGFTLNGGTSNVAISDTQVPVLLATVLA